MADATPTQPAAQERPLGQGMIGNLLGGDGIRAIAATMIFLGHVFVNADSGAGLENYGWSGIGRFDLWLAAFFVLSGYLVTRPFVRSYVLGTARPSVRRYARNRVLRIVPAFYVVAAIVLLRFGLDGAIGPTPDNPTGTAPPSSWWQVLSVFTFTQSYTGGSATLPLGHAWSLDAEAAFYLAIPLAAVIAFGLGRRLASARARARAALVFIGVLTLVSIWLRQHSDDTLATLASPPLIVYTFLPGVALAVVEPFAVAPLRGHPRRARRLGWVAVGIAALAYVCYAAWDYSETATSLHQSLGRRSLMTAIFGFAVVGGTIAWQLGTERAPRWLANRAMRYVGERSYAFYLLHVWVLLEVVNLVGADAGRGTLIAAMIGIGFPATLALSALSWRFVELPFLERRLPWARGEQAGPGTRRGRRSGLDGAAAPAPVAETDAPRRPAREGALP